MSLIPATEFRDYDYPQLCEYNRTHFLAISKKWWNSEYKESEKEND